MDLTDSEASPNEQRAAENVPESLTTAHDANSAFENASSTDQPVDVPLEQTIPEQPNAYTQFKLLHDPACLSKFELNDRQNYFKGCKWSPDGSCLMTCSNDKVLRLFNLPSNFGQLPIDFASPFELNVDLQIKESGLVYDYCFNPNLNSSDSSSCL